MPDICKDNIKDEVNRPIGEYLTIMCDETTDIYDKKHVVILLSYELQGKPVESCQPDSRSFSQCVEVQDYPSIPFLKKTD